MFDIIEPFADYSFPKAHAFGYGLIAYQTAFLKANYPVQYLAALLTSVKSNQDKAAVYLNECRLLDIPVLVPDVNDSESDFGAQLTVAGPDGVVPVGPAGAIRFGLSAVRNVGEGVAELILKARREGGPFVDFYDFCERVDPIALNKRTIESLVKAGAFDSLGHPRQGLLLVFEQIVDRVLRRRRERDQGTLSFFDLDPTIGAGARRCLRRAARDPRGRVRQGPAARVREGDARPLRLRPSAARRARGCSRATPTARSPRCSSSTTGRCARSPGSSAGCNRKYTKRGDLMATFVLEDLGGVGRGDGLPEDDAGLRRAARTRRDHHGEGTRRRARRHHQADRDGDHAARDRARRGTDGSAEGAPGRAHLRPGRPAARDPARASRRQPLLRAPHRCRQETVLKLGDEYCCDPRTDLFAELRVAFGPDCIA